MKLPHIANPIRAFAVLCVAVIAAYIMVMGWRINDILAGPSWCRTALGAEKISKDGAVQGADACIGLLTIQLKSLAINSHILFGVVALCLLTLIVIVIAGGKLSISASKTGLGVNVGKDDVPAAAQAVADGAQETADAIKTGATPAKVPATSPDDLPDYARP